jgi:hypothetical protein
MVYGTFSLGTKYDYDSDTKVSCSTLAAAPSATTRPIALGRTSPRNVGSTAAIGTIEFEPNLRKDLHEVRDRRHPAVSMATSKPGTMSMAIRTSRWGGSHPVLGLRRRDR